MTDDRFDDIVEQLDGREVIDGPKVGWNATVVLPVLRDGEETFIITSGNFPYEVVWPTDAFVKAECFAHRYYEFQDGAQLLLGPVESFFVKLFSELREPCGNTPGSECTCGFRALKVYEDAVKHALAMFTPVWNRGDRGQPGDILVSQDNLNAWESVKYALCEYTPVWNRCVQGQPCGILVSKVNFWSAVDDYGDHFRGEEVELIEGVLFYGTEAVCDAVSERYGIPIRLATEEEYELIDWQSEDEN